MARWFIAEGKASRLLSLVTLPVRRTEIKRHQSRTKRYRERPRFRLKWFEYLVEVVVSELYVRQFRSLRKRVHCNHNRNALLGAGELASVQRGYAP